MDWLQRKQLVESLTPMLGEERTGKFISHMETQIERFRKRLMRALIPWFAVFVAAQIALLVAVIYGSTDLQHWARASSFAADAVALIATLIICQMHIRKFRREVKAMKPSDYLL